MVIPKSALSPLWYALRFVRDALHRKLDGTFGIAHEDCLGCSSLVCGQGVLLLAPL